MGWCDWGMMGPDWLEHSVGRVLVADLPPPEDHHVAVLPTSIENLGLRLAWPVAIINLIGTVFGFWYYRFQLEATPLLAWPFVPDSPLATLCIALSLIAWRMDIRASVIHVLAFVGCIKLGFWTPFVQVFLNGPAGIATWLYVFLIVSHLAMGVEAFVIHRYAEFRPSAIAVAFLWYGCNDLVDYFWPILEGPHHTWIRAEMVGSTFDHSLPAHDLAAAWAVLLTVGATVMAIETYRVQT